jgi:hypothetical protein
MEALIWIVVALLVGLGAWFSYYLKKRRRQQLQAMARQLGLEFAQRDPFDLLSLPFALFQKGDGRGCENVMWGRWQDLDVRELDYWYYEERTDSEGKRSKTYYRFSCAVIEIEAHCPPLTISREDLFTRMADHLGFRDIEFELEEFNRAFQVKGKDRKFANDAVDARMMQWLLSTDRKFGFEIVGPWVLGQSKRRRPAELVPLLGTLKEFRDHLPRVVFSLYGTGSAPVG